MKRALQAVMERFLFGTPDEGDRLRVRLYLAGQVADEVWFTANDPSQLAKVEQARDRHFAMVGQAEAAGALWLVELFCPGMPPELAYFRFGTDADGITMPIPLEDG